MVSDFAVANLRRESPISFLIRLKREVTALHGPHHAENTSTTEGGREEGRERGREGERGRREGEGEREGGERGRREGRKGRSEGERGKRREGGREGGKEGGGRDIIVNRRFTEAVRTAASH